MGRALRGVMRAIHADRRKERRSWVRPRARIISRCVWISATRGGPGYTYTLKLRAGEKGTGRLLAEEVNAWEEELQSRLDELRQVAADLGYCVVTDDAPAVLGCAHD